MGLPQAVMQVIFPLSACIIARRNPGFRCWCMMGFVSDPETALMSDAAVNPRRGNSVQDARSRCAP